MSWRYATDIEGEAAGWSDDGYPSVQQALAEGRAMFDGTVWTAWVVPMRYSAMLPPAATILAEMRERAAGLGADTSCFDSLEDEQVQVVDQLLRRTLDNWENWLPAAARSEVVVVENARRHASIGEF